MVPEHSRNRKSIRLKEYDYSLPGGYFITICTFDKQWVFGNIVHEEMQLNACGEIVQEEWRRTAIIRSNVMLDAFVCMPNHVHGIIILTDVGANSYSPLPVPTPFRSPSKNLGAIIRGFKSSVTVRMNQLHNTPRQPVWQRGYYEHIIRNTKELDNVRKYILANPAQWQTDDEYPENNTVAE